MSLWRSDRLLSPYLKDENRLGDVIAAIQAMATYKFYKLTHERWADRISGYQPVGKVEDRVFRTP